MFILGPMTVSKVNQEHWIDTYVQDYKTPLLMHSSYHSLGLSHWNIQGCSVVTWRADWLANNQHMAQIANANTEQKGQKSQAIINVMMMYWHGNVDCITGPLWVVDSPHKGQQCRALIFSLLLGWTSCWTDRQVTSDFRWHDAHVTLL